MFAVDDTSRSLRQNPVGAPFALAAGGPSPAACQPAPLHSFGARFLRAIVPTYRRDQSEHTPSPAGSGVSTPAAVEAGLTFGSSFLWLEFSSRVANRMAHALLVALLHWGQGALLSAVHRFISRCLTHCVPRPSPHRRKNLCRFASLLHLFLTPPPTPRCLPLIALPNIPPPAARRSAIPRATTPPPE